VDLVPRQVLKLSAHGVAEVERQVLDAEEVVCRSPGVACEPVVLEPYAGVGVPVVSRYIGRSMEARRKLRVADALAKGPWTSLIWRPATVAVVAPSASTVVVVARAVVAVVGDTLGLPSGLDGVSCVAVGPKTALDR
jgi:hypothetical protein